MNFAGRFVAGAALALVAAASGGAQQTATLNKNERAAILALTTALDTKNYAAAQSAVTSAQNAASSGYARYVASALQLRLGAETNDRGMQSTAIDAMISSGAAPMAELPQLYRAQATLLLDAGKYEKAEAALTRAVEVTPGGEVRPADSDLLLALAEVKILRKKNQEAVPLMVRAIDLRRNAGQAVPESWYKRAAAVALANRALPEAARLTRELVAAYPSPENWRDAVLAYRDEAAADPAARIDALRLLREVKCLAGERDYMELAQALGTAGLNIEANAVLDQGVAAGMVDPAKAQFKELIASTAKLAAAERKALAGLESKAMAAATGASALSAADAHLGAGQYAKAAGLYQAAIQKGGVDAAVAATRLGIAYALAGQKAEAETAFRSINGHRADLGSLWLVWLGQRA
jgi:tetratricopeptide (TPR) repeat protein